MSEKNIPGNRRVTTGVNADNHPQGHKQDNMRCKQTQELIPAYIDRELDVLRNVAVENHFNACEACSGKHDDHLNLRRKIRTGARYFTAPDHLKTMLSKKISEV